MNNGGPAFPCGDHTFVQTQDGMTLRDWFAGQALAGRLAQPEQTGNASTARWCYAMADAMLAARESEAKQ